MEQIKSFRYSWYYILALFYNFNLFLTDHIDHITQNKQSTGNGEGFSFDTYEIWSIFLIICGIVGILLGGLAVDYVHNLLTTKKERKKIKIRKKRKRRNKKDKIPKKKSIASDDNTEKHENAYNSLPHSLGHDSEFNDDDKKTSLLQNKTNPISYYTHHTIFIHLFSI